jgi:hypothetical protein
VTAPENRRGTDRSDRLRRYPPLSLGVVAVLLVAFGLPSALNLPQTNPTQTQEFAPVPPNGKQQASSTGNLSAVGGAAGPGGAGVGGPGAPSPSASPATPGLPPPIPDGAGSVPSQYPCVGNPPKQTADPLSPPCVAYFKGDNGGATYQGVTRSEVKVIVLLDRGGSDTQTDDGTDKNEDYAGQCFDLGRPLTVRSQLLRNYQRWQRYFNYHYATYGRFVHLFGCFSTLNETPESRQSDAAMAFAKYHPFAVVTSTATAGNLPSYTGYMAQRGVTVFGSPALQQSAFFQRYPGRIWDYWPIVESQATAFSNYICTKVVNRPVVDSGDMNGQPRKLGLLTTTDASYPSIVAYGNLVKKKVQACGGSFAATATFPYAETIFGVRPGSTDPNNQYAVQNMARFNQAGVTTVIWAGGFETKMTAAAAALNYTPEWILGGDGINDGNNDGAYQEASEWRHATLVTFQTYFPHFADQLCVKAIREADPAIAGDLNYACADPEYPDLRQLFTGIQVAGPRLSPMSIDQGFHAIPAVKSTNPEIPACFYNPSDFSCTKDSVAEHWSPSVSADGSAAGSSGSSPGCWLMIDNGRRTLDGAAWPAGNIDVGSRPNNICNNYRPIIPG